MLIAVVGILMGFIIGLLVGLIRAGKHNVLYRIAGVYIAIIRGTPLMVQALYLYFAIPMLFRVRYRRLTAGIAAIGLNSGAHIAEIVRGRSKSIDAGQNEAGCSGAQQVPGSRPVSFCRRH